MQLSENEILSLLCESMINFKNQSNMHSFFI